MKTSHRIVLGLSVVVALAGGGLALRKSRAPSSRPTSASLAASAPRVRFEAGRAYRYRIEYEGNANAAAIPGTPDKSLDVRTALRGELVLRAYAPRDGGMLLGARFEHLEQAQVDVLGQHALGDDPVAALEAHEAFVVVTDRGDIPTLAFRHDAPDLFRRVAQHVLRAFAVSTPDTPATEIWTATQVAPDGKAFVQYTRDDAPAAFRRSRARYAALDAFGGVPPARQELVSSGGFALAPEGHLASVSDHERLAAWRGGSAEADLRSELRLDATLREVTAIQGEAPDGQALETQAMDAIAKPSDEVARLATEQAAGNVRFDALTDKLLAFSDGKLPDGFLTQASAALKLHPEYAARLVSLFDKAQTSSGTRALIMDVLTAGGTAACQSAMRAALDLPSVRRDPHLYRELVQRFSFVRQPTTESLAFLAAQYGGARAAGDAANRYASAYTLGAVAGKMARSADAAERAAGERERQRLVRDLEEAKGSADVKALVSAVGNSGSSEALRALRERARDESPDVRAAVALSLRRMPWGDARDALFDMLGDESGHVGRAAVEAMSYQPVGTRDMQALAALVAAGKTAPSADGSLVSFVASHAEDRESARTILEALLARNSEDPREKHRIEGVLQRL